MLSRFMMALLFIAAAAPVFAFYAQPAGYTLSEVPNTPSGEIVWDPATSATDFYAHSNGGLRRFDTAGGAFSSTLLFAEPGVIGAYGPYFDALAIDPNSPNDFYVSYSGSYSRLHKLTRTGADSSTLVGSTEYSTNGEFIYQLEFVPDNANVPAALRGQLLAVAAVGFSGVSAIYVVDTTTLALTKIIDVTATQASGPFTVDEYGNVYAVVPTSYGTPTGALLYKFSAAGVAAALTSTPVQPSQGEVLIEASDNEWNIPAITAREENGSTFLYYSTQEHASVFRMCVQTGESKQFMQGFGGVADGYPAYAAGGGSIAFTSRTGDFNPAGGGSVRLAIPYSLSTVGYGSYRSVYFLDVEAVNTLVASLNIAQQPTAINAGVPFSVSLEALNGSSGTILSNVAVVASATGSGELHGFTVTSKPGNALVVDGLVYSTSTIPENITLTFSVSGNSGVNATTAVIPVIAPAAAIALVSPPSEGLTNSVMQVSVELQNASGQIVTGGTDSSREVSVALTSGPGNLWGVTTVAASNGVADFSVLLIDAAGSYTLEFTSPGLAPQTMNVTISAPTASTSSDDSSDNGSCTAAGGSGAIWILLLALLVAGGVTRRLRRLAA
ncbi:MAG: hypothetical protein KDB68_03240 [Planctomycetes bacterium]|nr:hypothetical protein [Planctomycetota bacterium]